jgi:hypothetical protein
MPGDRRLWRLKYDFPPRAPGNKEKCISLGIYPEVSLEQARERRNVARQEVANVIDPNLREVFVESRGMLSPTGGGEWSTRLGSMKCRTLLSRRRRAS